MEFVKTKLNHTRPRILEDQLPRPRDRAMYILPDVIISRTEAGFEVEVVESRPVHVAGEPLHSDLFERPARRQRALHRRQASRATVRRARQAVHRQHQQRRQTILNITKCLVGQQTDFLEKGIRHLKPLSRAAVAIELGIHESTVSRATASKYVMLPDGEVIPFSHFFTPSLSIKDVIKEMIEREEATSPTRRSPSACASAASRSPSHRRQIPHAARHPALPRCGSGQ